MNSNPLQGRDPCIPAPRKTARCPIVVWLAAATLFVNARAIHASQLVTQSIPLQAGWNSVWLDVEPTNVAPAHVFAGIPLLSVWTFQARLTSVDFIQNPDEPVWNQSAWLTYVPINRRESLDNNLFAIHGGRAYLIRSSIDTTLNVTGRPVVRRVPWASDAYNLRGFPVDPGARPTFREFFRSSTAHFSPNTGQLVPIYRLNSSGNWQQVAAGELMQESVAYWVFCSGASDFTAPLDIQLERTDGLDFARELETLELNLVNKAATPIICTLAELQKPQSTTVLAYQNLHTNLGVQWTAFPPIFPKPLEAGASTTIQLAIRRANMTSSSYESLLEVRDNAGTRLLLPITAERIGQAPPAGAVSIAADASDYVGLWAGAISIDSVSEVHSGILTTNSIASDADGTPLSVTRSGVSANPTPTRSEFNLRLILHVDSSGTVRLLREVTQLWQDGTYFTNAQGLLEVATPGSYVLVTDDSRLGQYKGATLRNGVPVGRRLSTTGFDFPVGSPDQNFVLLNGGFGGNETLTGTITLPATHPTNPFRHKFHPDHDNLAADFITFREEAYAVTREFSLQFSPTNMSGANAAADYGYNVIGGIFRETVSGLHKTPIHAKGTFRLRRVADIGVLNP